MYKRTYKVYRFLFAFFKAICSILFRLVLYVFICRGQAMVEMGVTGKACTLIVMATERGLHINRTVQLLSTGKDQR